MSEDQPSGDVDRIISVLQSGQRQDLVILIIPSHDRNEKLLTDQEELANAALDLFAEIFGGATAFKAFRGIYKDEHGKVLRDVPILIESYVRRTALEDRQKLAELLNFAKRLGREARQAAVGLVINDVFHEIKDFS